MPADSARSEPLFSYGTLQLESVQIATFGRLLEGSADVLIGFELLDLEIDDPAVVEVSGKAVHTMGSYSGRDSDRIEGTILSLSASELASADGYEVPAVKRVAVTLESGRRAWAYVDARCSPPQHEKL